MENHPIPQDITGFQFKLIGDMTLKQFAYLAFGSVFAWIIFSLPVNYFFKLPLSSVFVFFGISFAFLSLGGRSMDIMILNFIKATFSPTKYIYQSPSLDFAYQPNKQKQEDQLNLSPVQPKIQKQNEPNELDRKEFDFFHMLSQMLHSSPSSPISRSPQSSDKGAAPYIVTAQVKGEKKATPPSYQEEGKEEVEEEKVQKLEDQTEVLQRQLEAAVQEEKENQGSQNYEEAHKKVLEIEKILNETLASKQSLEREIQALKKQLAAQQKEVYAPSQTPVTKTPNVRTIANKAQGKSAGLPIAPEFPNMVAGIVKDPRSNPIPNILVEIKDIDGNPVRAFKTNPLGQFQASTPLSNGTYTIEFEDPTKANKFDIIKFEAKGDIIFPLEIISIDTREELRKSLFN